MPVSYAYDGGNIYCTASKGKKWQWPFTDEGANVLKGIAGIFFRISLTEKTGEYKSCSVTPQPTLGYVTSEGVV